MAEGVAPAPVTSSAMSRSYYNLTAPVEHKEVGGRFSPAILHCEEVFVAKSSFWIFILEAF